MDWVIENAVIYFLISNTSEYLYYQDYSHTKFYCQLFLIKAFDKETFQD